MKIKIGQIIKFYIPQNDTCMASECYGFNPGEYSDWLEVQYYPEQVQGVITKIKGTILAHRFLINRNGERQFFGFYDLSKNGINQRIEEIKHTLDCYGLSEEDFFEDISERFDLFGVIEQVGGGV